MNPTDPTLPVMGLRAVAVSALRDAQRVVLEGVDWTVNAGEYWVVGGMEISGKSDLLALAAGLMPPAAGSYYLFGCDMSVAREQVEERLKVGLVFEDGKLLHQLTVRENLALPLRYHGDLTEDQVEAKIAAMLERTELSPFAETVSANLSRAARKRVGLARALMLDPELLLLDNPLTGQDLRQAQWWLAFIRSFLSDKPAGSGPGRTVVVTTQDLRYWVEEDCQIAVLDNRRFLKVGGAAELAANQVPLVRELLDHRTVRS
jgi:ABC-type transporter Mla maintaining outer membrane lipid asymmetry ATPase subunit MlaF